MTGRNTMPGDNTQKPGPGAHSPEKVTTLLCDFISLRLPINLQAFVTITKLKIECMVEPTCLTNRLHLAIYSRVQIYANFKNDKMHAPFFFN